MTIVIVHGKEYNEIRCYKCNAIIGYSKKDIKRKNRLIDCFGEPHSLYEEWIVCPECGDKIYFTSKIDGKETLDK